VIVFGSENRLGMKLYRLDRQYFVAYAHDHAIFGFRGDFQAIRQRGAAGVQRVIAAHAKFRREAFENAGALVAHQRWLAVHGVIQHVEDAAKGFDDALQSQADADYFAAICGRIPSRDERARLAAATLAAYRWQYIVSGVQEPRFQQVLGELTTEAQRTKIGAALAPLMQ